MKKIFTPIFLLALLLSNAAHAGLSGSYIIPGPSYGSLAAILADLNGLGASGAVTINLTKDENAPSGGYILGSSLLNPTISSTNTITINGNGHILTANSGTGNNDAIFTIQGADYVTINNLNLIESSSNTTATSMMERGYSVVKLSASDGVKTLGIHYCNITLNNTNTTTASGVAPLGSTGIFVGNCTALSNSALAPAVDDGTHDGIYFSQDTIKNVTSGIYMSGNVVTADGTANNDKNSTIQENVIQNFTYDGIYLSYYNNDLVKGNMINNTASGGTAPTTNMLFGIRYLNNSTLQTNTTWTCVMNSIKLTINSAASPYAATGIFTQLYGSGTTTISSDTVELTSAGSSAQLNGIFSQNNLGTQLISNNTMRNFATQTTNQQAVIGIYGGGYSTYTNLGLSSYIFPGSSTIDGNLITNFNVCSGTPAVGTSRVMACCEDNSTTASSIFTNNTVSNITINNSSTRFIGYGGLYIIGLPSVVRTTTITNNTFTGITVSGATNTTPVYVITPAGAYPTGNTINSSKNKINKITTVLGILAAYSLDYALAANVTNDTITDLTSTNWHVLGLLCGNSSAGYAVQTINVNNSVMNNFVSNSTGGGAFVAGCYILPGTVSFTSTFSANANIFSNFASADPAGTAAGINIPSGSAAYRITNNMISDIAAANNTAAYSSSFGLNLGNSGTNNIFYNTVNMVSAATAGSGYGSTGLLFNPSSANTIQNNILRVNVVPATTNNAAAIRASSGSASASPSTSAFAASSNIYYTPTGSNNYLFVMGTTNASLVNGYNISGLTSSNTTNIVNDTFFNSDCNRSSYHKFMQTGAGSREKKTYSEDNLTGAAGIFAPTGISYAESAATDVAVAADFKADLRPFGTADIGAYEFSGTLRPVMAITIASSTGFDTACTFNLPMLIGSIPSFFNKVSYQWYRDTTMIIGATTPTITVTPVTGNYILKVYDSTTGCQYGSDPYRITIVSPPPAIITYYDSLTFCESSAIIIHGNEGPNYLYRWMRNGSFIPGETTDHLLVDKSGDYNVEINTPLGCPTVSTSIHVKVYPLPTPVVYFVRDRTLGVTKKYFTYQWYRNNVKIADTDAIAPTYYVFLDGAYSVEVTDSNGCTAKSDVFLYSLGINEQSVAAAIKIYPNPATTILHIESPVQVNANLSDLAGRIIIHKENAKEMEISNLSEGMYLLTIMDKEGNQIRTEKINKTR